VTTPPLLPDEQVASDGERAVLATFLDMYRGIIARKIDGLGPEQLQTRLVPSETTLGGLVRHLTSVEDEWFSGVLCGVPVEPSLNDGWDARPDDTVELLTDAYRAACERSRAVADSLSLDHVVPHDRLGQVSLRWVYVHMIEETARHAGHADILREQTDGAVGYD
jgi:hypothetical protein